MFLCVVGVWVCGSCGLFVYVVVGVCGVRVWLPLCVVLCEIYILF